MMLVMGLSGAKMKLGILGLWLVYEDNGEVQLGPLD